ncbi:oxoglutarate iron-dependent oxygenase [Diplodia corticola]|uniref:Oxoglutarate iron-dependent oxygenase n=1 Tax=Diplodia corticola TaxID=236234 RepID=A0A1J9RI05_9PEZI|nr:oxoglutarate iron-dependent oxygenase [Diplodia corticola]OJD40272.1 oxoglutarate iron-dependent oxygenase [Diplodia corticola]
MPLPILDARALNGGTEKERKAFGEALLTRLKEDGAVKLVNTSIPDGDISNAFSSCKDFFHLPQDLKAQIANDPKQAQQRGWSVAGEEKTWFLESIKNGGPAPKFGDSRESIDIGSVNDKQFPNKWLPPTVLPKHQNIMESLFEKCSTLSYEILETLAAAAGLPRNAFTERCTHEASTLRSNNYAALDVRLLDAGEIGRAWPHKDFGIISLVFPGVVGGLEYEVRQAEAGIFEPVGFTSESDIVLLVSETMQRWTNDELRACLHRVQKPSAQEVDGDIAPERTSMVFFCKADRSAQVGPMPHFVGDKEPLYENMTALEYQDRRNKAHYPG